MMPVARYFLFVGGALLALLFAFDAFAPNAAADLTTHPGAGAGVDKSVVRIRSSRNGRRPSCSTPASRPSFRKRSRCRSRWRLRRRPPKSPPRPGFGETFAQFTPVEPKRAEAKADVQAQRKRKIVHKLSSPRAWPSNPLPDSSAAAPGNNPGASCSRRGYRPLQPASRSFGGQGAVLHSNIDTFR